MKTGGATAPARWRCGVATTTTGVAWNTGGFEEPFTGAMTCVCVDGLVPPFGPGKRARTATDAPSATATSGTATFDADQADNRLRRDRDTSLPHHDSRVISPKV